MEYNVIYSNRRTVSKETYMSVTCFLRMMRVDLDTLLLVPTLRACKAVRSVCMMHKVKSWRISGKLRSPSKQSCRNRWCVYYMLTASYGTISREQRKNHMFSVAHPVPIVLQIMGSIFNLPIRTQRILAIRNSFPTQSTLPFGYRMLIL